jgi:hypothetical protein
LRRFVLRKLANELQHIALPLKRQTEFLMVTKLANRVGIRFLIASSATFLIRRTWAVQYFLALWYDPLNSDVIDFPDVQILRPEAQSIAQSPIPASIQFASLIANPLPAAASPIFTSIKTVTNSF